MRISPFLQAWSRTDPVRKYLRLAALACALVTPVLLVVESAAAWFVVVPVLIAAILSVLAPEGEAALGATGGTVLGWAVWHPAAEAASAWSLVAALSLLGYHVLLAMAGHAPDSATMDRRVVSRFGRRTGVVAAITVAAWVAVVGFSSARLPAPGWAPAAALLLLSVVVLAALGRARQATRD